MHTDPTGQGSEHAYIGTLPYDVPLPEGWEQSAISVRPLYHPVDNAGQRMPRAYRIEYYTFRYDFPVTYTGSEHPRTIWPQGGSDAPGPHPALRYVVDQAVLNMWLSCAHAKYGHMPASIAADYAKAIAEAEESLTLSYRFTAGKGAA